ncbi:MAG: STAS domain-containing protein [Bacteroidaceae bacterium]|nr:STAS domain-containing protein [Bacteroidaceae bacterium]
MKVIIENGNPVVAKLQGRLDTTAAIKVAPYFQDLNQYAAGHLVIDCGELEYISSSGLRLLLTLRKEVAEKNGKLQIRNMNEDIQQIFKITGFISLFEIVD